MTTNIRLGSRETIAEALRRLADDYEEGSCVEFSIHTSLVGTARLSAIYAEGFDPELPGVPIPSENDNKETIG